LDNKTFFVIVLFKLNQIKTKELSEEINKKALDKKKKLYVK
jgi:hypothetical protein